MFRVAVATLIAGSAGSQLITILMAPVLARLYEATHFGTWALFIAISSIISVISTGRYEMAIQLPKSANESRRLGFIALVNVLVVTAIAFICVAILWCFIALDNYWILLPFAIFFGGINLILNAYLVRIGKYKRVSQGRIIQSLITAIFNLFLGILLTNQKLVAGGELLIIGSFLGLLSGALWGVYSVGFFRIKFIFFNGTYDFYTLNKYRDFIIFSVPESLLSSVAINFPIFIFSYFWDEEIAGQYSLAYRCLMLPIAIIGGSISQVNFRNFSIKYREKLDISSDLKLAWTRSAVIGLIPALLLFFLGQEIFVFFLGTKWSYAGEMASSVSLLAWGLFICSTVSGSHVVLRMQNYSLIAVFLSLMVKIMVGIKADIFLPIQIIIIFNSIDLVAAFIVNFFAYKLSGKNKSA